MLYGSENGRGRKNVGRAVRKLNLEGLEKRQLMASDLINTSNDSTQLIYSSSYDSSSSSFLVSNGAASGTPVDISSGYGLSSGTYSPGISSNSGGSSSSNSYAYQLYLQQVAAANTAFGDIVGPANATYQGLLTAANTGFNNAVDTAIVAYNDAVSTLRNNLRTAAATAQSNYDARMSAAESDFNNSLSTAWSGVATAKAAANSAHDVGFQAAQAALAADMNAAENAYKGTVDPAWQTYLDLIYQADQARGRAIQPAWDAFAAATTDAERQAAMTGLIAAMAAAQETYYQAELAAWNGFVPTLEGAIASHSAAADAAEKKYVLAIGDVTATWDSTMAGALSTAHGIASSAHDAWTAQEEAARLQYNAEVQAAMDAATAGEQSLWQAFSGTVDAAEIQWSIEVGAADAYLESQVTQATIAWNAIENPAWTMLIAADPTTPPGKKAKVPDNETMPNVEPSSKGQNPGGKYSEPKGKLKRFTPNDSDVKKLMEKVVKGAYIEFNAQGYPIFDPYVLSGKDSKGKDVKLEVWIKMTGSRQSDDTAAKNKVEDDVKDGGLGVVNWSDIEDDGTWHHKEGVWEKDGELYCVMQFVTTRIHQAFRHDGAVSQYNTMRPTTPYK